MEKDLTDPLKYEDTTSDIKNKQEYINVELSRKELELIFTWYFKGYSHVDKDQPLYDKLQKIYKGS